MYVLASLRMFPRQKSFSGMGIFTCLKISNGMNFLTWHWAISEQIKYGKDVESQELTGGNLALNRWGTGEVQVIRHSAEYRWLQ